MATSEITTCVKAASKLVTVIENLSSFVESHTPRPLQTYRLPQDGDASVDLQQPTQSDEGERVVNWTVESKPQQTAAAATSGMSTKLLPLEISVAGDLSLTELTLPRDEGLKPFVRYVDLILCGLKPGHTRTGRAATVLLENPIGCRVLSFESLVKYVRSVFGLRGVDIHLFLDSELTRELAGNTQVDDLSSKTIFVASANCSHYAPYSIMTVSTPICKYVNFEGKGKAGTLLLENPKGDFLSLTEFLAQASTILDVSFTDLRLSTTREMSGLLNMMNDKDLASLHGITIFYL